MNIHNNNDDDDNNGFDVKLERRLSFLVRKT